MHTIAVMTGGGDSSGINCVLRAIVLAAAEQRWQVLGIKHGWRGLINGDLLELGPHQTEGISHLSGTLIGTSRTNPFRVEGAVEAIGKNLARFSIDGLIAIGGDDTLGVATKLSADGLPVVGIPQTIDNDIYGTEYCVGFDTAVNQAIAAVDAMVPSNNSHQKDMIVEVMGRDNGWIGLSVALATQTDYLIIPERELDVDHMIKSLATRKDQGREACLVLVAEGITLPAYDRGPEADAFGNKSLEGIAHALAAELRGRTGWDLRVQILGFIQRGGRPTAYELRNSVEMGQFAVDLLREKTVGVMIARVKDSLVTVPLADVGGKKSLVPEHVLQVAQRYGCFGV